MESQRIAEQIKKYLPKIENLLNDPNEPFFGLTTLNGECYCDMNNNIIFELQPLTSVTTKHCDAVTRVLGNNFVLVHGLVSSNQNVWNGTELSTRIEMKANQIIESTNTATTTDITKEPSTLFTTIIILVVFTIIGLQSYNMIYCKSEIDLNNIYKYYKGWIYPVTFTNPEKGDDLYIKTEEHFHVKNDEHFHIKNDEHFNERILEEKASINNESGKSEK